MGIFLDDFDGCLFDMDGLLLDTESMFLDALLGLSAEVGIAAEQAEAFFLSIIGTPSHVTSQRLEGFLPASVDRGAFEAEWRERHKRNRKHGVPVKPHAKALLETLKARGTPMAVVTSTAAEPAREHLEESGLWTFFDAICAGDEVSANKPHPEPYLTGAGLLGVSADRCVAFEDSDLGTQAATSAGCFTFQVPDLRPTDKPLLQLGQTVVPHLGEAGARLGLFAEEVR